MSQTSTATNVVAAPAQTGAQPLRTLDRRRVASIGAQLVTPALVGAILDTTSTAYKSMLVRGTPLLTDGDEASGASEGSGGSGASQPVKRVCTEDAQ